MKPPNSSATHRARAATQIITSAPDCQPGTDNVAPRWHLALDRPEPHERCCDVNSSVGGVRPFRERRIDLCQRERELIRLTLPAATAAGVAARRSHSQEPKQPPMLRNAARTKIARLGSRLEQCFKKIASAGRTAEFEEYGHRQVRR
jgi:hypothetical protein